MASMDCSFFTSSANLGQEHLMIQDSLFQCRGFPTFPLRGEMQYQAPARALTSTILDGGGTNVADRAREC